MTGSPDLMRERCDAPSWVGLSLMPGVRGWGDAHADGLLTGGMEDSEMLVSSSKGYTQYNM